MHFKQFLFQIINGVGMINWKVFIVSVIVVSVIAHASGCVQWGAKDVSEPDENAQETIVIQPQGSSDESTYNEESTTSGEVSSEESSSTDNIKSTGNKIIKLLDENGYAKIYYVGYDREIADFDWDLDAYVLKYDERYYIIVDVKNQPPFVMFEQYPSSKYINQFEIVNSGGRDVIVFREADTLLKAVFSVYTGNSNSGVIIVVPKSSNVVEINPYVEKVVVEKAKPEGNNVKIEALVLIRSVGNVTPELLKTTAIFSDTNDIVISAQTVKSEKDYTIIRVSGEVYLPRLHVVFGCMKLNYKIGDKTIIENVLVNDYKKVFEEIKNVALTYYPTINIVSPNENDIIYASTTYNNLPVKMYVCTGSYAGADEEEDLGEDFDDIFEDYKEKCEYVDTVYINLKSILKISGKDLDGKTLIIDVGSNWEACTTIKPVESYRDGTIDFYTFNCQLEVNVPLDNSEFVVKTSDGWVLKKDIYLVRNPTKGQFTSPEQIELSLKLEDYPLAHKEVKITVSSQ